MKVTERTGRIFLDPCDCVTFMMGPGLSGAACLLVGPVEDSFWPFPKCCLLFREVIVSCRRGLAQENLYCCGGIQAVSLGVGPLVNSGSWDGY